MSIWFAILLGVGILAAFAAVIRHSSAWGIYVGSSSAAREWGPDHDRLQVRVYVEEPLAHDLPAPSRLTGRMFIRETDTSVPLMFVHVPPHVSLEIERSDEWQGRVDVSVLPVIFRFDPVPDVAVHAGQLVDFYLGER
jgi:HlyD family secretion protein